MNSNQPDLFGNGKSTEEVQVEGSIKLLEKLGYRVSKTAEEAKAIVVECGYQVTDPLLVNNKVVTLTDLRNYFFMRLWSKHPSSQQYSIDNIKSDLRLIRLFVEAREEKGLNRFNAIQQCVAIIDIIFNYEEDFCFKEPISIGVLGQAKSGWITEKALYILNTNLRKEEELEIERRVDEIEASVKIDLKARSKELAELLANVEADNGKKEG
jgi:hypothetical protein